MCSGEKEKVTGELTPILDILTVERRLCSVPQAFISMPCVLMRVNGAIIPHQNNFDYLKATIVALHMYFENYPRNKGLFRCLASCVPSVMAQQLYSSDMASIGAQGDTGTTLILTSYFPCTKPIVCFWYG